MAFTKHKCANKPAVVALYGASTIVRKLDPWDIKVTLMGDPLSPSFEKDHLITIKVPGDWAGDKTEVSIRVNKALAHLYLAAFQEIEKLKLGYKLKYDGAYAFRYNTAKMPRLEGRSEYDGVSGADKRFAYAEKDRKDGDFNTVVNWVDKKNKMQSASKKSMLSNHAFGNAIDLNYGTNPMGASYEFDMPSEIVKAFAKFGFDWGGYYHDYTHFEYMLDHIAGSANVPVAPPEAAPQKKVDPKSAQASAKPKTTAPIPASSPSSLMAGMQFSKDWLERQWLQFQDKNREEEVAEAHDALQSDTGFFPVGLNLTWHGGIHCRASSDGSVHAVTDGVVVAARLPEKDPAKLSYGSRNFVLVKHKTLQGKVFWSLFMHLRPLVLKADDNKLAGVLPWLVKRSLARIGEGTSNLRNAPDQEHGEVVAELQPGETFDVHDEKTVGTQKWLFVHAKKADQTGWVALTGKYEYKTEIPNLEDLKAGKVVKFNAPVKRGDCLGFISPTPPGKNPFLHWEIFSSEIVSNQWVQVKDEDNDIVCDAEDFKKLLNKSEAITFFNSLTKEDILAAYSDPKTSAAIRKRSFFFKSEWSVDWKAALQKRKDDFPVDDLAPRLQLYNFWKDAEAQSCDLPKGGKVWHYHPAEFLAREFPVAKAAPVEKAPEPQIEGQLISAVQLKAVTKASTAKVDLFLKELNDACKEKHIDNNLRLCHFLAQVSCESGCLRYVEELADGSAYEGRKDLGNVQAGDGPRFKGRGLIQITGRSNYAKLGEAFNLVLTTDEGSLKLKDPYMAVRCSTWYWDTRNLNNVADQDDVLSATYKVNGGFNGVAERVKFLGRAYAAYSIADGATRIDKVYGRIRKNIADMKAAFGSEKILSKSERKALSKAASKEYQAKVADIKKASGLTGFNTSLYDYFSTEAQIAALKTKVES